MAWPHLMKICEAMRSAYSWLSKYCMPLPGYWTQYMRAADRRFHRNVRCGRFQRLAEKDPELATKLWSQFPKEVKDWLKKPEVINYVSEWSPTCRELLRKLEESKE